VSELVFDAFNGASLKVAIDKGLLAEERIEYLIERYAQYLA